MIAITHVCGFCCWLCVCVLARVLARVWSFIFLFSTYKQGEMGRKKSRWFWYFLVFPVLWILSVRVVQLAFRMHPAACCQLAHRLG